VNRLAVITPVIKALSIAEEVDRHCGAGSTNQPKISNGSVVAALIANRLTSPTPLSRVETWAEDLAIEECLGVTPETLNDDGIAGALGAVEPHTRSIEAAVAVNAVTRFWGGHEARTLGHDHAPLSGRIRGERNRRVRLQRRPQARQEAGRNDPHSINGGVNFGLCSGNKMKGLLW